MISLLLLLGVVVGGSAVVMGAVAWSVAFFWGLREGSWGALFVAWFALGGVHGALWAALGVGLGFLGVGPDALAVLAGVSIPTMILADGFTAVMMAAGWLMGSATRRRRLAREEEGL